MTPPVQPRERISRSEYDAARRAGYSDEEIRAEYDVDESGLPSLGMQGQAPDASRVDPNRLPPGQTIGPVRAAAQSAVQGAFFGLSDEAMGVLGGVMGRQDGEGFGDAYRRVRDRSRADLSAGRERHPVASGVGQLFGTLAVPGVAGLKAVQSIRPTTTLGQIATGAAIGGTEGAIQGFGEGEGDASSQLGSIARGGGLGAAGGAVAGAIPGGWAAARRSPRLTLAGLRTIARAKGGKLPAADDVNVAARGVIDFLKRRDATEFSGLGQRVTLEDLARGSQEPLDANRLLGDRDRLGMSDLPIDPNIGDVPEGVSIPLMDRPGIGLRDIAEQGGRRRQQGLGEEVLRSPSDELSRFADETVPFPTSGSNPVLRHEPPRTLEQIVGRSGRTEQRPLSLYEYVMADRVGRGKSPLDQGTMESLMRAFGDAPSQRPSGLPASLSGEQADMVRQLRAAGIDPDEVLRMNPDEYRAWVQRMRSGR